MELFHLILIEEGYAAVHETCETFDELKTRLRQCLAQPAEGVRQLFVVRGRRWYLTAGAYKFLVPPPEAHAEFGPFISLFDAPTPQIPPAEDGTVDAPPALPEVRTPAVPAAPVAADEEPEDSPFYGDEDSAGDVDDLA